jgi:DNA-binding GntR family transcriptional regulator
MATTTSTLARGIRKLETLSLVDTLERELERRILDGDFAPGEHLREVELAEEYGVGRHTLRAAFDCLVRRRLLEKERHRGIFVRALTDRDLDEIYQLRTAVEVEAIRRLAVRGEVPPLAQAAVANLRKLGSRPAWRRVVRADLDFHRELVAAAGNVRLTRVHDELHAEILLCLAQLVHGYASAAELAAEHAELLRAIETRQPDMAERALRDHLEPAVAWLRERAAVSASAPSVGSRGQLLSP